MIIGIIPVVSKEKKIYFKVDAKLIDFLKFCFGKKIKIKILKEKSNQKLDFIVASGGNDLLRFNREKRNLKRNRLDHFYLKFAITNRISYLGICFGAQKIANFFGSSLCKTKLHVKCTHEIKLTNKNKYFKRKSYHNYKIKKLKLPLVKEGIASNDNSCEFFSHRTKKIFGIMWHPERKKKFSNIEKKLLLKML